MELSEILNQKLLFKILIKIIRRVTSNSTSLTYFEVPEKENIQDYATFFKSLGLKVLFGDNHTLYVSWAKNTKRGEIREKAIDLLDNEPIDNYNVIKFARLIDNHIIDARYKGLNYFVLPTKGISEVSIDSLTKILKEDKDLKVDVTEDNIVIEWK